MILSILVFIILIYIMYTVGIFVIDYIHIFNFFKYDAPEEIAVFKKEFNIKNRVFDYIAIIMFLLVLPFTYYKIEKKGC